MRSSEKIVYIMSIKQKAAQDPFYKKFPLICAGATLSETSTFPIDFIKTTFEIRKSRHASEKMSTYSVIKDVGPRRLYRGLPAAIMRHWWYSGARYFIYEGIRDPIQKYIPSVFFAKMLSGALAGSLGQFIASPTDLVKIRMINSAPGTKGYESVRRTFSTILRKEGFLGLYRGVGANASRAGLVNMGELASYDISKQAVKKYLGFGENIWLHSMASIISGFFSSLVSKPADTIKSKMMSAEKLNYNGTFDCIMQTVKQEGLVGMYRGFFHCWIRLGPWQFIFWNSYEQLRKLFGLSAF